MLHNGNVRRVQSQIVSDEGNSDLRSVFDTLLEREDNDHRCVNSILL